MFQGEIMCTVDSTFGARAWRLPKTQIPHPHGIEKFKLFAKFFLEGKIVNCLKK